MAIKGFADNPQQAFTPALTDWMSIQQGELLENMKKITYEDLMQPLQGQIDSLDDEKADKDTDAVAGNFAYFDGEGNPVDSGKKDADYEPADATILKKANVVDGLESEVVDVPLSANQGRVLKETVDTKVKLTKMPDGATAVYSQDAWATVDGWWGSRGDLSVENGVLTFLHNATAGNMYMSKTIASIGNISGKTFAIKIYANKAFTLELVATRDGAYAVQKTISVGTADTTYFVTMPVGTYSSNFIMQCTGLTVDSVDYVKIDFIWVGDYSYLANSLSTEASRIANQLGDTAGVGTKASGMITSNGTNVSDGDTVTIAGKVYTFKTVLGTTEGNVLIGGTAAESLDNLKLAINSTGVTAEQYCASYNPLVEATTNTDTVQILSARNSGLLGNSITLAKSATTLTVSGDVLTGGIDDVGSKILNAIKHIDLGNDGKNYKILACVIRPNISGGWDIINDADHTPINVSSVSLVSNTAIQINYAFTAKTVGTLIATADETFVLEGITAGASVGVEYSRIAIDIDKQIGGYIYYNGSGWDASWANGVINTSFSNGVLTINHINADKLVNISDQFCANVSCRNGLYNVSIGTTGNTFCEIYFRDFEGNLVTAPTTDMKIYFQRSIKGLADVAKLYTAGANIWVYGIMEV